MHLLRCESDFFSSFLSPWIFSNQVSPLYQDTRVHCKDQMLETNRLVMALLFPQLGSVEGFSNASSLEFILPDWVVRDVEEALANILALKDEENFTQDYKNREGDSEPDAQDSIDQKMDPEELLFTDTFTTTDNETKEDFRLDINLDKNAEVPIDTSSLKQKVSWGRHTCNVCQSQFRYLYQVKEHAQELHQATKFLKCEFCDFETHTPRNLKRHENAHTKAIQYPCDGCDKTFNDQNDLNTHLTTHDTTGPVQCNICEKSFKNNFRLKKHNLLRHKMSGPISEDEEYICEICSSVFKTNRYLARHIKNVHCEHQFMCSLCDKKFKRKSHLNEHERYHRGESKTTKCEVCGFLIKGESPVRVKKHMETHYNKNSTKCDKCNYYFRNQIYLIDHMEISHS